MLIGGIDEAGRGPVIGPMVMALVVMREEDISKLIILGVKDSKLLSPKKRIELYGDILDVVVDYKIKIISNTEIDDALNSDTSSLNLLEVKASTGMINESEEKCELEKVYVDCPSINRDAYHKSLKTNLKNQNLRLFAEHKADLRFPVVAAASILAKVTRDNEIQKLKDQFDVDFGSGYPSDPATKLFIKQNYDKYPFFRKSWSTWKIIKEQSVQKNLFSFGN